TDFSASLDGVTDIGARFTYATGFRNLGNCLARRLITPRGSLSWDLDAGTDVRTFLNHGDTPQARFAVAAAVNDECLKDERVDSCSTDATFGEDTLTLTISIVTAAGPFKLVLLVDGLTVEILEAA